MTLPSGTVTLLFTDIEGSTRLLQNLGVRYSTILDLHHTLIRNAIAAHHGQEVNTEGDAFFAAFDRAIDGLKAAAQAQRALSAFAWPDGIALRVRMGLHTGTPLLINDDYVGLDVHRAARIASAAHGGQVLLSLATRELCEGNLPPDFLLQDLGTHMLKDLHRLEHIYQLVLPELHTTFPPIKSLNTRSHNLPAQQSPLLGREQAQNEICALLLQDDVRLLTLIGPGGIGKTRLSIQVAAEMIDAFPEGVYFIALAPISDPNLVLNTIAQTLGLQETTVSAKDWLIQFLRNKQMLLILDNFEQVVESSYHIAQILENCAKVKIVATTRIPLHILIEKEYPVPPLAFPAAGKLGADLQEISHYASVVLFIERARSVKPDFQVTNANASAIADICARLDGLPLAIELAASRIKYLSPQVLLNRLSSRLKVLTGGARDLPIRQQTLFNLISWSYDLLLPDEKILLQRLSIFSGGSTVEAIETICGEDDLQPLTVDILDGVGSLVDKSLVIFHSGSQTRFGMLETIREFALAQLYKSEEYAALRQSYFNYYLSFAETGEIHLLSVQQQYWLELLEQEQNNFREILAWSVEEHFPVLGLRLGGALWRFWLMRGYLSEGLNRLEALLALYPTAEPDSHVFAKALYAAGTMAIRKGKYGQAEKWLMEGLLVSKTTNDAVLTALILNGLAITSSYQQKYDQAAAYFEESLALHQQAGYEHGVAIALLNLGEVAYYRDQLDRAEELTQQAEHMLEQHEPTAIMAVVFTNLASIARRRGAFSHALAFAQKALVLQNQLHDSLGIAEVFECLGKIFASQGKSAYAARVFGASSSLRAMSGAKLSPSEFADLEKVIPSGESRSEEWSVQYALGQSEPLDPLIQNLLSETQQI